MRALATLITGTGVLLGVAGCGSSNAVWVTCEITKDGKPYVAPSGQVLQVTFYAVPQDAAPGGRAMPGEPYPAAFAATGRYEVPGPDGRGIPPGKYRVAVIQKPKDRSAAPKPKSKAQAPDRDHDFLEDKFSPVTSPIILSVERSAHMVVALDRPATAVAGGEYRPPRPGD